MLDCGAKHFTRYYLSFDDQWYVEFGSFFFLFLSILVIRMAFQKKKIFFLSTLPIEKRQRNKTY